LLATAALLGLLAAVGERYPLHLTHKMAINVASAAYLAMVIVFPPVVPGALAALAVAAGLAHRRLTLGEPPLLEGLFNIGQCALYVTAGATIHGLFTTLGAGSSGWLLTVNEIAAVIAASLALHLVNTALVAVIAALELGLNPARVWWVNLSGDLPAHVALSAVGVVGAFLALHQPLLLPALALPVVLVHHAIRKFVQLHEDTTEALVALVEVIELRDPYTAGHSRRVAETARALAIRLGLTAEEADLIESAGRVHDLGKVAIDPAVLSKPGKLDAGEWEQMRLHPVYGASVISRFNAFAAGHDLIRYHHERWDGKGYPDGIAGEDIPLGARILAVADTWDALTSDRPYRAGMSRERALAILAEGAGTQWDPRVVAALLAHLGVPSEAVAPAPQPVAVPA
jgi:hypothetical protein